jgi:hypothetical protein
MKDTRFEQTAKPWENEHVPTPSNRVVRWGTALAGDTDSRKALAEFLEQLAKAGHSHGLLRTTALRVRLTEPKDPYWRCTNCARVHLHHGAGLCTRCFDALADQPTGRAAELQEINFLGLRVKRSVGGAFRLHCEELTGQTDDPATRQRRFRGVIMPDGDAGGRKIVPERDTIDLLASQLRWRSASTSVRFKRFSSEHAASAFQLSTAGRTSWATGAVVLDGGNRLPRGVTISIISTKRPRSQAMFRLRRS